MYLLPREASQVLRVILKADPIVGSTTLDVDYRLLEMPPEHVQTLFEYIKHNKPKYIEINKRYESGWIANIVERKRSEIEKFLQLGGFEMRSNLSDLQYRILLQYKAATKLKWSYLRDTIGKSFEFMNYQQDELGKENHFLRDHGMIEDLKVTGDFTYKITPKGITAIFMHEQQLDTNQLHYAPVPESGKTYITASPGSMVIADSHLQHSTIQTGQGNNSSINHIAGEAKESKSQSIGMWIANHIVAIIITVVGTVIATIIIKHYGFQ